MRETKITGQEFFWEKNEKDFDHLPKNFEYTVWKVLPETVERFAILCICTGQQRGKIKTFLKKARFSLIVCPPKSEYTV